MNRGEAARRLSLSDHATDVEVEQAFRAAMKDAHPDVAADGNAEQVAELIDARAVMLDHEPSQALVPIGHVVDLVRAFGGQVGVSGDDRVEKTVKQVVMHQAGRFAEVRRRRLALATLSGGVAALIAVLDATTKFGASRSLAIHEVNVIVAVLVSLLALAAASLGLLAWHISGQEKRLTLDIEECAETLSDKGTLLDTLYEIAESAGTEMLGGWTRRSLIESVDQWCELDFYPRPRLMVSLVFGGRPRGAVPIRSVAAAIGPVDFTKLLTAKGVEQELIADGIVSIEGRNVHGFQLTSDLAR